MQTEQISTSKLSLAFYHLDSEWNSIRIGFWSSARSDIYLGFIAESVDTSNQKTYSFTRRMASENDNYTVARIFLHGYEGQTTN